MRKVILVLTVLGFLLSGCDLFKKEENVIEPEDTTSAPVVAEGLAFTNINPVAFSASSSISENGGLSITQHGFVYSDENENPTRSHSKIELGAVSGQFPKPFSADISSLKENTKYHVRAFATNEKGTAYSKAAEVITTKEVSLATFTSESKAGNITTTSFKISSTVSSNGNSEVTQHGHVYSTTDQQPTTTSPNTQLHKITSGYPYTYSSEIKSLQEGTRYYVRPYAINSKGTAYGTVTTVNTLAVTLPIMGNSNVARTVTYNSVSLTSTVDGDGNSGITQRGHILSTAATNPTLSTSGTKVTQLGAYNGNFPANFTSNFGDLAELTTYYVRPYATNAKGTSYGTSVALRTLEAIPSFTKPSSFENVPIYQLQLQITTANTNDGGTDDGVSVQLKSGTKVYYLDEPHDDRERGKSDTYTIIDPAITKISDINTLVLTKDGKDRWDIKTIRLIINSFTVFLVDYGSNAYSLDGDEGYKPTLSFTSAQLRANDWWKTSATMTHTLTESGQTRYIYTPYKVYTKAMIKNLTEGWFGNQMNQYYYDNGKKATHDYNWRAEATVDYKNTNEVTVTAPLKNYTGAAVNFSFTIKMSCTGSIVTSVNSPLTNNIFNYGLLNTAVNLALTRQFDVPVCGKTKFNSDGSLQYW